MDKKKTLDAFSALSQETRLEAFRMLVKMAPQGLPAGEISARLGVVQNTMSAHLAVLGARDRSSGFVLVEGEGARAVDRPQGRPCATKLTRSRPNVAHALVEQSRREDGRLTVHVAGRVDLDHVHAHEVPSAVLDEREHLA